MKIADLHMKITGFHERPLARNCNPYVVHSVVLLLETTAQIVLQLYQIFNI